MVYVVKNETEIFFTLFAPFNKRLGELIVRGFGVFISP